MSKESLKQIAYNTIKNKILTCDYKPNAFLNEDIICADLKMSRTPVRDALSRIEQENLIKIFPKKGFLVSSFSINDVEMIFEARLLLEPYIILNYCQNIELELINELKELNEKIKATIESNGTEYYIYDNEFHFKLMSKCSNSYFLRTYNDIDNQNSRLRFLSGRHNSKRLEETYNEHKCIIDELEKNNLDKASDFMKKHLEKSKTSYYEVLINNNQSNTSVIY
ncbi:GntR family transcriptional regulator [Brachyspira alvinipulli]|uniref:GntR family transcriptional regulator n=1 Tax=Brachyspira alvinipulli TaxID=84379 RepID=UPI00047FA5E5|nr:GntR family transcriptional regulator [Brachyspira alvinipulli]